MATIAPSAKPCASLLTWWMDGRFLSFVFSSTTVSTPYVDTGCCKRSVKLPFLLHAKNGTLRCNRELILGSRSLAKLNFMNCIQIREQNQSKHSTLDKPSSKQFSSGFTVHHGTLHKNLWQFNCHSPKFVYNYTRRSNCLCSYSWCALMS